MVLIDEDETTQNHRSSKVSETTNLSKVSETTNVITEESAVEGEGFETASEGEPEIAGEEQSIPPIDDHFQETLTEEQLNQRALNRANDRKTEGNQLFGSGEYEDALLHYAQALQLAPETPISSELRSICHANSAICYLKLGKYEETIKECTKALELNSSYLKALVRRGEAHEKLEHFEEAIADMKKILELDSSHDQARRAIQRLEPLAAEKREKMKEEMIGKMKEMGSSLLGRFGMSLDNFKAVKDPNTGSYSISFQR